MNAYEMSDELLRDNTQLTVKAAYMLRQQADRIAELEKSSMAWYEAGKFVSPQIKELSDEEIRVFMAEMPHLTERKDLLMFARAILKKASEK